MIEVTLASASTTRAQLFSAAGIAIHQKAAKIDEENIQKVLVLEEASPRDIADTLAEYKARQVALSQDGLVIGCDQTLSLNNQLITKATDRDKASEHLLTLQGKTHLLYSAAVIYEDQVPVWRVVREAKLVMRPLTKQQIENYLDQVGDDVLSSVGCYHLEGIGAQLFTSVEGSYFTVLGLPLLDVLGFLRTRGIGLS